MTEPSTLQVAEYLPDMPAIPASGSDNIRNVIPRTPLSYGSIGTPMPVSSALAGRCQGAAAYLSNDASAGAPHLFAGDRTNLYHLVAGDAYVWEDATNISAPYNVSDDEFWEFEYFNGVVLGSNIDTNIQSFTLSSSSNFVDLAGSPPRARHMSIVKNSFLMLGFTDDAIGGIQPQRLWWSGAGDPTSWPTPGGVAAAQAQSGYADLFGNDGHVQAVRSGLVSADALVLQQYGARRCIYAGPPQIFEFLPLQNARGTPAPWCPVVVGGICYYYGYDGWYSTDGSSEPSPIGANKIDKTFKNDVNETYIFRMVGSADPVSKMLWWAYPSKESSTGIPDRLLGYNWQLQRWTIADISAEFLTQMIGLGYTLDELYTILGYTLDTLPAPLDSPVWAGGALGFGMFDTNHKLNFLTGAALPATVETSEMQVVPGRRAFVSAARPLIDGSGMGRPSVSIAHRERLIDPVQYSAATSINAIGICPARTSGRYLRALTTVGAGGDWVNISGVELDLVPAGKR